MRSPTRRTVAVLGSVLLSAGLIAAPAQVVSAQTPSNGWGKAAKVPKADLDVLYVGAHPDDEAGRLSMFGEWRERFGEKTGVVTITRGEGGGNAVGPEEGPDLGLIREREERSAVGKAGVTDVYNLDKVDFYYSVSAPLHQQAWDEQETLNRLVRVIRSTRPELITTMNPAPAPGNHGGHQLAARLAAQAYQMAGDPQVFPEQIKKEGLEPFAPAKLLTNSAAGTAGTNGAACTTTFKATDPTDDVYGVWSGRTARSGKTWAQIEREAQREYASQGWSGFPDVSADPASLGCDYMMQVESRVPYTRGDMSPDAAPSDTMLQGATRQAPGGLPLGTGLDVSTSDFEVVPGGSTSVKVALTAPRRSALRDARARITLPEGWTGPRQVRMGTVKAGRTVTKSIEVAAPGGATTGKRVLVGVDVASGKRSGYNHQQLEVVGAADGKQQALPQVAEYEKWTADTGLPQLAGRVTRVLTLPQGHSGGSSGGGCSCPSCCSRTVGVDVRNNGDTAESGTVTLALPAGFSADETSRRYEGLAPGETRRVDFEVTVDDPDLKTSNQGGTNGDYAYNVTTTSSTGSSTTSPALELVPTASAGETAAPTLDGQVGAGEYSGQIDLSRLWEGTACTSAADCSATGYVTRSGDALYVAAKVTDDTLGTVLSADDCKRHWRVDSVEIAIDPTGRSENTSSTFKAAVLPTTTQGVACASRDADNQQGPIGQFPQVDGSGTPADGDGDGGTAPGFEAVSKVNAPYTGYVIEAKIPFSVLPATVDPERMAMNMFVYDSDTQDKTGQTRIGWSTWGGVQGDPYRWGRVAVGGEAPPEVESREPELDFPALDSLDSPQSIEQAVRTGVALAGLPAARENRSARLESARMRGDQVAASIRARGPGRAHLSAVDSAGKVVGQRTVELFRGRSTVRFEAPGATKVLLGYSAEAGGSTSSSVRVR